MDHLYRRRQVLLERMRQLQSIAVDCQNCSAPCCTFQRNSMQVSPREAYDLYLYLKESGRWTDELKEQLQQNVREFRLDHELYIARGKTLRRYYTCPFFAGSELGCTIPPQYKPYGCLGYNPTSEDAKEGEHCQSDQRLLEIREIEEDEPVPWNWQPEWSKKPVPIALLELFALDGHR